MQQRRQEEKEQPEKEGEEVEREVIWKRNAPHFYQLLYTMQTEWPTLSVEWWASPGKTNRKNDDDLQCHLTLGTHAPPDQQNFLQFGRVYLPRQDYIRRAALAKNGKLSDTIRKNDEFMEDKLKVLYEIEHNGEVNKIRHHPKYAHFIATRTPFGEIHIFDKNGFKLGKNTQGPTAVLGGHETEGYAMEWNPIRDNYMVGGSYDGKLSVWDWQCAVSKHEPLCNFQFHESEIEDVSCSQFHPFVFASCDDAGYSVLWDTRSRSHVYAARADPTVLYALQFSPHLESVFATGGADQFINIWDIRNLTEPIVRLKDKAGQINQLKWSNCAPFLWSVAAESITLWDTANEKPCFVHGGHFGKVSQIDLHYQECETVASVDQNNEVHIFQPNPNAYIQK